MATKKAEMILAAHAADPSRTYTSIAREIGVNVSYVRTVCRRVNGTDRRHGRPRLAITDSDARKAVALRKAGISVAMIASHLNCGEQRVYYMLRQLGAASTRVRPDSSTEKIVVKFYEKGFRPIEIMRRTGFKSDVVKWILRRYRKEQRLQQQET